jgi:hypothetical protein
MTKFKSVTCLRNIEKYAMTLYVNERINLVSHNPPLGYRG